MFINWVKVFIINFNFISTPNSLARLSNPWCAFFWIPDQQSDPGLKRFLGVLTCRDFSCSPPGWFAQMQYCTFETRCLDQSKPLIFVLKRLKGPTCPAQVAEWECEQLSANENAPHTLQSDVLHDINNEMSEMLACNIDCLSSLFFIHKAFRANRTCWEVCTWGFAYKFHRFFFHRFFYHVFFICMLVPKQI